MRGIAKEEFIKAIQKANIDIVLDIDIEDLFCDLGKECKYDKEGKPVFCKQPNSRNNSIVL